MKTGRDQVIVPCATIVIRTLLAIALSLFAHPLNFSPPLE
jgi:hypothetical protein